MISLRRKHPRYERLSQLADSELSAAEAMEVNAHLAVCDECRAEVDFMLELRERLTELSGPPVPQTLLPEILSLRAMGDRVILDHGEFDEPKRQRSKVQMAAGPGAAALLFAGAFTFFGVNRADAGANSFEVELDAVGEPETLVFSTAGTLASEATVRARGAYFESLDYAWEELTPIPFERDLQRTRAGEYSGDVTLHTEAAYASFSVEDLAGRTLEGGPAPWGFLPEGAEGNPTFDGLLIQSRLDFDAGRYATALATARTLTSLYPDRVASWGMLYQAEDALGELSEGRREQHRERLRQYAEEIASGSVPVTANHIAAVTQYAASQQDGESLLPLMTTIQETAPGHPFALELSVGRMAYQIGADPGALTKLEEAWDEYGTLPSDLFFRVVRALRDADLAEPAHRWASRWVAAFPHKRLDAVQALTQLSTPNAAIVETLADAIEGMEKGDLPRPVGVSVAAHEVDVQVRMRDLSMWLGRYQIKLGRVDDGYRSLLHAADHGWNAELFFEVAQLALARGERQRAIQYLVLASLDPLVDGPLVADARRELNALGLTPEDIVAFREDYSSEVDRRMFFGQAAWPPADGDLRIDALSDVSGGLDLADGSVSIAQFWTPLKGQSSEAESSLAPYCTGLVESGVRVLRFTTEPAGSTGDLAEIPCSSGSYFDRHGDVQLALGRSYLEEIVVVDRQGQVRFRGTNLDDAVRAALHLGSALN